MLDVNYNLIDPKYKNTVKNIESKPHVRYIRYLLTKRYSPATIKKELNRLALSAPHEPNLIAYYLCIIDPLTKAFGVGPLYSDYKNKLLRKNSRGDFAKDILNYRLHVDDDLDMQVKFCKFVRYLDIGDLWINEIYRYHGSASNLPVDENGQRILDATSSFKVIDKILMHPKRYLIDKMILENVPDKRIADYFRDKMDMKINAYDIACYKKSFFNIKTQSVEDRIKFLEIEKTSLEQLMEDLDNTEEYINIDLGEKILIKKQSQQRIAELEDNIKTLNAMYSEFAFKAATEDKNDFLGMFSDIVVRGYSRFCQLDNYKDRDVVDPLVKTAKMMGFAYDKVENIQNLKGVNANGGITDEHSQGVLMELYSKRIDEIAAEQIEIANKNLSDTGMEVLERQIHPDEIAGIEDLGTNIDTDFDDIEDDDK